MSWKDDLFKGSECIRTSGCIDLLTTTSTTPPHAKDVGVGIYVCMAAEILLRDVTPATMTRNLADGKQLMANFLPNTLKVHKNSIPKIVTAAMEKLVKDWLTNEAH